MSTYKRPKLKIKDLKFKVATKEEIEKIRIKAYKYIDMGKTGVSNVKTGF